MNYDEYLNDGNPVELNPLPLDYESLYFDLVNKVKEIHEFICDLTEQTESGIVIILEKKLSDLDLPC